MEEQGILVLSDDMGGEAEFEVLDLIDYEDKQYVVLLPMDENDTGIVILEMTVIDEENADYLDVEDEDILNAVFDIFKEEHKDEFDFAD
ncbi:MAG: DUF1292 domain-containing protein [Ruminococcaceae bacterium]|nr:DUF1292 domain-containing protein [Oscillospiraceae bacterium]